MTTVVNVRVDNCDVYVGRPSVWGNPFVVNGMFSRTRAIAAFEAWIKEKPELLARLHELRGKRLGCYCKPLSCHGDVLARLADEVMA